MAPLNAYDKNGLKIVIHIAKNKPREDVTVMVVSTISTNTNPVKNFVFQAAVPKVCLINQIKPCCGNHDFECSLHKNGCRPEVNTSLLNELKFHNFHI